MNGKVAVIGAGATGVVSTKVLVDAGFVDIVCFERKDVIGGLWNFKNEKPRWTDESCVNRATVINTSKELMSLSDFPMPEEYPNFCHNTMVKAYFENYTKNFGIEKYIRYNTEVLVVKKDSEYEKTGKWQIESLDHKTGQSITEVFDFVLLANGHHGKPKVPNFPGLESFKGEKMHSRDFKSAADHVDKRAIVVGVGNSGGDIASELGKYSQVYLSTRRGVWILYRLLPGGLPWDVTFHTRWYWWIHQLVPRSITNYFRKIVISTILDHDLYGLRTLDEPDATHPLVNDELPNRIACGMVKVKPNIDHFTETGVVFDDGTQEDNIDLVIFATGYYISYPFLDSSVLGDVKDNQLELYKHMWVPGLSHNTLAIMGAIQPLGAIFPIAEMQARLAARVFKGEVKLPDEKKMRQDFIRKSEKLKKRYVASTRHTFQVDYVPYMDELANLVGCKPNLVWYLFTDPMLWYQLAFGPGANYQYRLSGPNPWAGARHAQLTVMDRIEKPFRTRRLPEATQPGHWIKGMFIGASLVAGVVIYFTKYENDYPLKSLGSHILASIPLVRT